jgi:peptidoglycan/xylan/chitin deacetylase (PgdA/CDA1 family)
MRFGRIGRTWNFAERLRKRFDTRALILAYHRIADAVSDPWGLCVSAQHFAEHIEILSRRRPALSMREFARRLRAGRVPCRSVAVTFDDGYADNLFIAKPLLERHDVPATVFVASGHIGDTAEFWWDGLQALLLEPRPLPPRLHLEWDGGFGDFDLGDAAKWDEEGWLRHRSWRASDPGPTARHDLYRSLYHILRQLPQVGQREILAKLAAWAGVRESRRPAYRTLSATELRSLGEGGLIEIGAHSVTHPPLSTLPEAIQQREIADSRATLEGIVDAPVVSFAYPYADRSPATASIVSRLGFVSAVTTDGGAVCAASPFFELPRAIVPDVSGDRFSEWLDLQFAGV